MTTATGDSLNYTYDALHRLQKVTTKNANGTATPEVYYYVLNLQGDVVALIDENGAEVANYTYNAWGEILTSTGTMAEINPLRYRGYYYDTETGFYYLQSRYYDPITHRFINADSYASTGQGILGTNMFAYCGNSPVIFADPRGFDYALTAGWAGSLWWLTIVDVQLPIGDIIYAGGCVVCAVVDTVNTIGVDNIAYFADGVAETVKQIANKVGSGTSNPPPPEDPFRSPTAANFRYNLQQLTGSSGTGQQAHHVLPQRFETDFLSAGIENIHVPKFGAWVDTTAHARWSYAYNKDWEWFFAQNQTPTTAQVLDFARKLAEHYGFTINF